MGANRRIRIDKATGSLQVVLLVSNTYDHFISNQLLTFLCKQDLFWDVRIARWGFLPMQRSHFPLEGINGSVGMTDGVLRHNLIPLINITRHNPFDDAECVYEILTSKVLPSTQGGVRGIGWS